MTDRIDRIKYIDNSGVVRNLKKPVKQKKIESKFKLVYTDFGIFLLIPIVIGISAGYFLDLWLHSQPVCTLIGIVFGGIFSIYNLYTILIKDGSNRTTHKH